MLYSYAVISKDDGFCFQVNRTTNRQWNLDIEECYCLRTNINYSNDYLGKYYYDGLWWERTWSEYETITETAEDGSIVERSVPIVNAGYVDIPWEPETKTTEH